MSQRATNYQETLIEKLLGRNYKWWYLVVYTFRLNTVYITNEVLSSLNKSIVLLSSLIIFTFLQKESVDIITYLLIGNVFLASTDAQVSWFVGNSIKDGKIARHLLLPQSFLTFIFYNGFSIILYMFVVYMISLLPLLAIFFGRFSLDVNIFWLFLIWPIVGGIRLSLELLVGLSAFWTTEFYGASFLNITATNFFSGSIFPLYFISNIWPILNFTPFAFMLYHPMQIYLGKYSNLEILYTFLGGIVWCVVLYLLAKLIFKLGLKRNESVGL